MSNGLLSNSFLSNGELEDSDYRNFQDRLTLYLRSLPPDKQSSEIARINKLFIGMDLMQLCLLAENNAEDHLVTSFIRELYPTS